MKPLPPVLWSIHRVNSQERGSVPVKSTLPFVSPLLRVAANVHSGAVSVRKGMFDRISANQGILFSLISARILLSKRNSCSMGRSWFSVYCGQESPCPGFGPGYPTQPPNTTLDTDVIYETFTCYSYDSYGSEKKYGGKHSGTDATVVAKDR